MAFIHIHIEFLVVDGGRMDASSFWLGGVSGVSDRSDGVLLGVFQETRAVRGHGEGRRSRAGGRRASHAALRDTTSVSDLDWSGRKMKSA